MHRCKMIWTGRRDGQRGTVWRPSEKSFSFIPWTLIPRWHATDSLFNVYSVVCPADRYLVNQRVSCPCSNSCHHPLPVAALFVPLPSFPFAAASAPAPFPSVFVHVFSIRAFIGPLSRQNAICRAEFIERVRAFTHANVFYVRPDNITACLDSVSAPYAAVWSAARDCPAMPRRRWRFRFLERSQLPASTLTELRRESFAIFREDSKSEN